MKEMTGLGVSMVESVISAVRLGPAGKWKAKAGEPGRHALYSVCQKFFPLIPLSPQRTERVRVRGG